MAQLDFLESSTPQALHFQGAPHETLPVKTSDAYRTISEASAELDVPQHVLRFWETHFPQIKPSRIRGRRYYRPDDLQLLRKIKILLYAQGYTIKGAKKLVKTKGFSFDDVETGAMQPTSRQAQVMESAVPEPTAKKENRPDIKSLISELRVLRTMLSTL